MSTLIRRMFGSLRQRSRAERYRHIHNVLALDSTTGFLLDLGGGPASFFAAMFPQTGRIVLVDIDLAEARRAKRHLPALRVVVADGSRLPFADRAFSATVCNSVIEHVTEPRVLAMEVRRVSGAYFVQTPNGRFPLETHSHVAIPMYNWLPSRRLKHWVCRLLGADYGYVSSVRYLSETQLKEFFPDASLTYEQVLGLTKSFYVTRAANTPP
ncbi:MAG: methyltransferase domain-containing protein [Vicinamibacterales bacterium]